MARPHDRPGHQPDDDAGPLDGRHHRPHRCAGPGQEHHPRRSRRSTSGTAFDAGLAIVIMAIVLDRLTTRASERARAPARPGRAVESATAVGASIVLGAAASPWRRRRRDASTESAQTFPTALAFSFADPVNAAVDWINDQRSTTTRVRSRTRSRYGLINPMEARPDVGAVVALVVVIFGIALLISGRRAADHGGDLPAADRRARDVGAQHGRRWRPSSWRPS